VRGAEPLRVLLLLCATTAFGLGVFAFAGDRLGLWEPLTQAGRNPPTTQKGPRAAAWRAHRDPPAARAVGPPVGAFTAFVVATLAGGLALLVSARARIGRVARRPYPFRLGLLGVRAGIPPPVSFGGARRLAAVLQDRRSAAEGRPGWLRVRIPRHRRLDAAFYGLTAVVGGATGCVVSLLMR
jgi:hypothetical protein